MTEFELEAFEQDQFERDYKDWCKRFDTKYIVEREEDLIPNLADSVNQKN